MKRRLTMLDSEIPGRFYPPGTRKKNRGYVWRGPVMGSPMEFACSTRGGGRASTIEEARDFVRRYFVELERPATRAAGKPRVVYFLAAGAEAIKIGTTRAVSSRLNALSTGNHQPLRLLGSMPGDVETERDLQRRFRHLKIRAEWFRAGPDLLEFIAQNAEKNGEGNGEHVVA